MASVWTEAELNLAITNTKAEINARLGIGSYMLNDGMGTQQVSNRSLKELRDHLEYLETEKQNLDGSGILTLDYVRDIGGI